MNDKDSPLPPRWSELVQAARDDRPPAFDVERLVQAVHRAAPGRDDWLAEFVALFGRPRLVAGGLAALTLLAVVTTWQAADYDELVEWVAWVGVGTGGGL